MKKELEGLTCILMTTVVFLIIQLIISSGAVAAPKLNYQGRLLNPTSGNVVVDGSYSMIFKLYTVSTGGSAFWTEIKDVTVTDGIFSTLLGDVTPLDPNDFDGNNMWLGMSVGADPQMTPRQQLTYVPYSVYSNDADTLDGRHASEFSLGGHTHPPLPTAYGLVRFDAQLRYPYNVDSVIWNSTYNRYEINLTGIYYSVDDVTVASLSGDSGSCPAGSDVRQSSIGGKLLIYVVASNGAEIQCSFRFISYAD